MDYCRTHKTGNLEIIDNGTKPTFANLKLSDNKDIFNIIEEALAGGQGINKKTKTYLVKINEENHAVQIWVSISGFANNDRNTCFQGKINKSTHLGLLKKSGLTVTFVPFASENITKRQYKPKAVSHLKNYNEYSDRKDLFTKFLSTLSNSIANSDDVELDPYLKKIYFLSDKLIETLKLIQELMLKISKSNTYNEYRTKLSNHKNNKTKHDKSVGHSCINEGLNPLEFLSNISWRCYIDDAQLRAATKELEQGQISFYDISLSLFKQTTRPIYLANRAYIDSFYTENTSDKKTAYRAFATLWLHMNRFSIEELTDMMKQCAETNLIKYLNDEEKDGRNIFDVQHNYKIFSTCKKQFMPLCDVCSISSLLQFQEIYEKQTGQEKLSRTVEGSMPITIRSNVTNHV